MSFQLLIRPVTSQQSPTKTPLWTVREGAGAARGFLRSPPLRRTGGAAVRRGAGGDYSSQYVLLIVESHMAA